MTKDSIWAAMGPSGSLSDDAAGSSPFLSLGPSAGGLGGSAALGAVRLCGRGALAEDLRGEEVVGGLCPPLPWGPSPTPPRTVWPLARGTSGRPGLRPPWGQGPWAAGACWVACLRGPRHPGNLPPWGSLLRPPRHCPGGTGRSEVRRRTRPRAPRTLQQPPAPAPSWLPPPWGSCSHGDRWGAEGRGGGRRRARCRPRSVGRGRALSRSVLLAAVSCVRFRRHTDPVLGSAPAGSVRWD